MWSGKNEYSDNCKTLYLIYLPNHTDNELKSMLHNMLY